MKIIRIIAATAFAALALSAMAGATPAAASYLALGEYPAVAEGNSEAIKMNLGGRAMNCDGVDFVASVNAPTQQLQTIKASETTNCSWFAGSGQLDLNSCEFVLHPGNPNGSIDIGPAGCGSATLSVGECTWSIPAQTGIATSYSNQNTKPASVSLETSGSLSYSVVSGNSLLCGKGTLTGALYTNWNVTGWKAGAAISATVTDHPSVGLFLTGNQLAAESYPVSLVGVQSAAAKRTFNFQNRTVTCNEVSLTGSASSASSSFGLSPSYSGCSAVVLGNTYPATVDASGCTEAYSVTASKAPYTASLNLNCSSPLKVVVTSGESTLCAYEVASQSGLGAINLANTGSGSTRGVDVEWQIGSLAYSRTSGTLLTCGKTGITGTATGTVQVHGSI